MENSFVGKRTLVTGAGQGIGKEIVTKLHKYGSKIVALGKNEITLNELKQTFPDIETVTVDLSDWTATKTAVEKYADVDFLVNNAGINILQPMGNITEEAFDKVLAVNLKAPVNISQIISNEWKRNGKAGAIVNLSSISGLIGLPERVIYCSSKGAISMATKVMALELGPYQIRTNAVAPTMVDTSLGKRVFTDEGRTKILSRTPLGRIAETNDVADAVIFLLSDQAALINGVTLAVDGGLTVI